MKVWTFVGLAAVSVGLAAATGLSTAYGPNNCVSLSLSPKSTCVITTDCTGEDTTLFEFAFDCVAPDAKVVQHSFGSGGFNAEEEYDTEVGCQKCFAPVVVAKQPKKLAAKAPPAARPARTVLRPSKLVKTAHVLTAAKAASKTTQATVVVMASSGDGYGPNGCVSTWKNPSGRCVMKTDCQAADITNYDFGLVCVDKSGQPVQHLFGVGSFSAAENFDTLITCDSCLGTNFEDLPKDVAVTGQMNVLFKEVTELKTLMVTMSKDVAGLKADAVARGDIAASPAPAAVAPAAAAASFMLHRSEQVESADEDEQPDEPQPPPQPKKHHGGRKAAKNPKLRATPREEDIPVAQAQDETSADSSADSSDDGSADANAGTVADASDLGSSDDSASRDDASAGDGQQAQQQDANGASDSQEQQPPQDVEVDDGFDG